MGLYPSCGTSCGVNCGVNCEQIPQAITCGVCGPAPACGAVCRYKHCALCNPQLDVGQVADVPGGAANVILEAELDGAAASWSSVALTRGGEAVELPKWLCSPSCFSSREAKSLATFDVRLLEMPEEVCYLFFLALAGPDRHLTEGCLCQVSCKIRRGRVSSDLKPLEFCRFSSRTANDGNTLVALCISRVFRALVHEGGLPSQSDLAEAAADRWRAEGVGRAFHVYTVSGSVPEAIVPTLTGICGELCIDAENFRQLESTRSSCGCGDEQEEEMGIAQAVSVLRVHEAQRVLPVNDVLSDARSAASPRSQARLDLLVDAVSRSRADGFFGSVAKRSL